MQQDSCRFIQADRSDCYDIVRRTASSTWWPADVIRVSHAACNVEEETYRCTASILIYLGIPVPSRTCIKSIRSTSYCPSLNSVALYFVSPPHRTSRHPLTESIAPHVRDKRALPKDENERDKTPRHTPPTASNVASPAPNQSTPGVAQAKKKCDARKATASGSSSESEDTDIDYEEHDLTTEDEPVVTQPLPVQAPSFFTPLEQVHEDRMRKNKQLLMEFGVKQAAEELAEGMKRPEHSRPKPRPIPAKPKLPTPGSPRKTRSR